MKPKKSAVVIFISMVSITPSFGEPVTLGEVQRAQGEMLVRVENAFFAG